MQLSLKHFLVDGAQFKDLSCFFKSNKILCACFEDDSNMASKIRK